MFKLFSYSDMGMLFQRSHISFQTTGKRIRIHSHFFEIQKLVTSIVRTRVRGTSSADNLICIYIICLSGYVCKDDDVRLRRFNAYYLLRQFVGCFTNERKLDRKYYIKTLDLIVQGMHFSGQVRASIFAFIRWQTTLQAILVSCFIIGILHFSQKIV